MELEKEAMATFIKQVNWQAQTEDWCVLAILTGMARPYDRAMESAILAQIGKMVKVPDLCVARYMKEPLAWHASVKELELSVKLFCAGLADEMEAQVAVEKLVLNYE